MTVESIWKARYFHFLRSDPITESLIEILSDPLQDALDATEFITDAFESIDDTEGEQLDRMGALIGVTRPPLQETRIFRLSRIGETDDPENNHGFFDDSDTGGVRLGGYLTTNNGLQDQTDPDAEMSDADYRFLIKQKGKAYRTKMTREALFLYCIAFGSRCKIDGTELFQVVIDPITWDEFGAWAKNYIGTKGFKPNSTVVRVRDNMRHKDSI